MSGTAENSKRQLRLTSPPNTGDKLSNNKQPGKRKSRTACTGSSDKISGFHPLRSLRNIFFGYRNKEPASEQPAVLKAKSTDDLLDPTSSQSDTKINDRRLSLATAIFNKQLSISADNLVSPGAWRPAPHGIAKLTITTEQADGDNASEKDAESNDSLDDSFLNLESTESLEEFFKEKWTNVNLKLRSYSSGDADVLSHDESFQDLDAVRGLGSLDVKSAKDKIAVKPKGKRISADMMFKMKNSPTPIYFEGSSLFRVEEGDEEMSHDLETAAVSKEADEISAKSKDDTVVIKEKENRPDEKKKSIVSNELLADALIKAHKGKNSQQLMSPSSDKPESSENRKAVMKENKKDMHEGGIQECQKGVTAQELEEGQKKMPPKIKKPPPTVPNKEPRDKEKRAVQRVTSDNVTASLKPDLQEIEKSVDLLGNKNDAKKEDSEKKTDSNLSDETAKNSTQDALMRKSFTHLDTKISLSGGNRPNLRPATMFHDSTGKPAKSNNDMEWLVSARKKKEEEIRLKEQSGKME